MIAYTGRMSRNVRLIRVDFRTWCSFEETKFLKVLVSSRVLLLGTLLILKTVVPQACKGDENVLSFKVKTEHSFLGYHGPRWLNIPDRKILYVGLFKKHTV